MPTIKIELPPGKKVYFASDFHLGIPNPKESSAREQKIVRWLNEIGKDAKHIFFVGDIFDFWFEYEHVVPKGYIRFLGKLAELTDRGTKISFFTGNHDMWMFDYLPHELDVRIYREPCSVQVNGKKLLVGHGDGLGRGDKNYKLLKRIFNNRGAIWLFRKLHPDLGIQLARYWSHKSRKKNENLEHDEEWLHLYCVEKEKQEHYDYYVFGHRHLPLELSVFETSIYFNLGDWITYCSYGEFDGKYFSLKSFEG